MKAFKLETDQLLKIIAALIAEEVNRRTTKHIDFLTTSSWSEASLLVAPGIGLSPEEVIFSRNRVARFFGFDEGGLTCSDSVKLGDWVASAETAIGREFRELIFRPAGRELDLEGCVHRTDQIYEDAAAAANLFHGRRRFLSLVAPHGLLGFVLTVVTPNLQGAPSIDMRISSPTELSEALQFGDVIIATPTLWRYIIEQGVKAPDNTMGIYFGEPMTPDLSAEMRQAGFGAQREIYGTSENGLIGWRDSPTEPFILFDHWRRDRESLLRISDSSTVPVTPMDKLDWSDERRFNLAGRRDGAVQIGAVNIFPDKIAQTLLGHRDVENCMIEIRRHKGGVNRVIANIKLKLTIPPTEAVVRDINKYCRSKLRAQERPSIFHFKTEI